VFTSRLDFRTMRSSFNGSSNNLDFIRLFLAMLVIFSHSFPLASGSEAAEPLMLFTHGQSSAGHLAVDLFFVISGFLITSSFDRSRSVSSFIRKRVRRIYPGFCFTALLGATIVLPISHGHFVKSSQAGSVADVVVSTSRLQEFNYGQAFARNPYPNALNGSLWSISYEFWCYLGVAALGVSGGLRSRRLVAGVLLLSVVASILFDVYRWTPGGGALGSVLGYPPFWARLLPMYMAGVVFYRFRERIPLRVDLFLFALLLQVAAAFGPHLWSAVLPLAGAYCVFCVAYAPGVQLPRAARFGDLSYGTYLFAFPVQQLIMQKIGHPIAPVALFLMATPLTLVAALISWHGVERWFAGSLQLGARKETEACRHAGSIDIAGSIDVAEIATNPIAT
jgi:peptidoglycan/LPS O-acetylase OafA/YrhL